jgi:hypothetical protein
MSTCAYIMLTVSVCLALTACGASVEVEPSDAGPLCSVAESPVCTKGGGRPLQGRW